MDPNVLAPVRRGPGRPRKVQPPPVDPSVPLHPWANTYKVQQQKNEMLAAAAAAAASASGPSTSYRPPSKPQTRPSQQAQQPTPLQHQQQQQQQHQVQQQQQQHHSTRRHSPQSVPAAVAPVSTASFYAQPQPAYQNDVGYVRGTPRPISEPQFVVAPPPLPRKKVPSRADLDFLLGGSSRARARSSTPNDAAVQARQASRAPGMVPSTSAAHRSSAHAHVAGPSRSSASAQAAYAAQPLRLPVQAPGSRMSMGEEADISGELNDDGLPLGAEAVMESDHEGGSSFEADVEDADASNEKDDPNDRDFRLYDRSVSSKRLPRLSDMSADAAAGGTVSVDGAAPVKRKRGRPSRASLASAAGKVPGSDVQPKRKRGRPPKELYTPAVIEQIRAANSLLGLDLDLQEGSNKMPRLDQIIDRKTRKAMSPEMRQALLRARNTQLQRERRERLRLKQAEAALGEQGTKVKEEPMDKLEPEERGRKSKRREDDETGSGSAILERAKGKVSEWIKSISSEAESGGPEDPNQPDAEPTRNSQLRLRADSSAASSTKQRPTGTTPPIQPPAAADDEPNIDPRLVGDENDDELMQGYFSRFGTVTGAANQASAADEEEGGKADKGKDDGGERTTGGVVGDEYYFSN